MKNPKLEPGQVNKDHKNSRQCNKCANYYNTKSVAGAVHLASCRIYNGWKNYETWCVNLWIDNDEGVQRYWRCEADDCAEKVREGEGNRYADSPREKGELLLADRLKERLSDGLADLTDVTGMWADLLGSALAEVAWRDIAEGLMESVSDADFIPEEAGSDEAEETRA